MDINDLLTTTIARNASDLHLVSGHQPTLRIHGELKPLVTYPELGRAEIESLIFSCLTPVQKELLLSNKELDFSTVSNLKDGTNVRFRINSYYQQGTLSASFRLIPTRIKSLDELHLPGILEEFSKLRQGFVLLTGPSGQGKTTTIASLIQKINSTRTVHIISIEDPIEYVFPKGRAIISQREMFSDTHSWHNALRNALREDPDIVYIGEMRDYETVSAALTIAETGHLVFSTLHTNSASQTIDRIIDIFPASSQAQVKMQLSMVISGIVTQRLIPTVAGERVPVCEILIGTGPIRSTIREGKTHMIDNIIQTSSDSGMILFEEHLKQRVVENIISHEVALQFAIRPETYLQLMQR